MRLPPDPAPPRPDPAPPHPAVHRRGLFLLVALGVILVALVLIEVFSGFYANFLWFHYAGVGAVWREITATKIVLGAVFFLLAFAASFVNLLLVEIIAPRALFMAGDSMLVRRYQGAVGRHVRLVRTGVSLLVGLLFGIGASGEWQKWLLLTHSVAFGRSDPLFNVDASLFVFRLPFLSFLVGWLVTLLVVILLLACAGHLLNGAIRPHGSPRIEPRALAHLSLVLGALALVRAWGYYFVDRYRLDLSSGGVVQGASYTDAHVRLPATTLLALVALAAFVMLVFNAYQRSVVLPVVALGLWGLLAFSLGVVYPAVLQAFKVAPSAQSLERSPILHNITATQYAMGIGAVTTRQFPASEDLTADVVSRYATTLQDAPIWDATRAASTFAALQVHSPAYRLTPLALDRYRLHGVLTPVFVSVRALNGSRLSGASWQATHLQYTHGAGALVALANAATRSGQPVFVLGGTPARANAGGPALSRPDVYFAPGESGYAVVDTTTAEESPGNSGPAHYGGTGGVPVGTALNRIVEAVDLHDFNLLTSGAITARSRLITEPGVRARVARAFPFLRIGANPYAVIDRGRIEWVVDGYTTSATYPDAEAVPSGVLPAANPLAGGFNYVRDAVKIVVDAYNGTMRAYVMDPTDPVIRAYEAAFPQLFAPASSMDPILARHLRYPLDLLSVQALMYSRYHVSNPSAFYLGSNAWQPAATATTPNGTPLPAPPTYELLQLPGDSAPTFEAVEALVPYSPTGSSENLAALLFASSAPDRYGRLEALVTPRGDVAGPATAAAAIARSPAVSRAVARLSTGGATVSFGTPEPIPVADSLLYVEPLYVKSSPAGAPSLALVAAVYGSHVAIAPTLSRALGRALGVSTATGRTAPSVSTRARRLLEQASGQYAAARKALAEGALGSYQLDVAKAAALVAEAEKLLGGPPKPSKHATTTTPGARTRSRAAARARSARRSRSATASTRGGVVEEPAVPAAGVPAGSSATATTGTKTQRSSTPTKAAAPSPVTATGSGSALGARAPTIWR